MANTPGYTHKNIAIEFTSANATFAAQVNGEWLRAPSLSAMRKKIDQTLEKKFEPFKAISVQTYTPEPFTVLRVENSTGRGRRDEKEFITDITGGWQERLARVTLDTPENRAQIQAYKKLCADTRKQISQLEEAVNAARRAIPEIHAAQFGVVK